MNVTHTPGPWWVAAHTADASEEITPGCDWTIYGSNKVSICFEGGLNKSAAADVRLITAAPDLLEALITLRDADDYNKRDGQPTLSFTSRISIETAISKALGAI